MAAIEQKSDSQNGTLAAGTYYFGCGGDAAMINGIHFRWDSALVAVITFERSSFPDAVIGSAGVAGEWVQTNPASAQIDIVTGYGTVAAATITIPGGGGGGAAGGATVDIGNSGQRLTRAKVVVTTQGFLRAHHNGKE